MKEPCYTCYIEGLNLVIQPKKYIDDGWLIKVVNGIYKLYEIPQYGGHPEHLLDFECAKSAIEYAKYLS